MTSPNDLDKTTGTEDDLGILNKCGVPATHIYQWPGIYATYICQEHLLEAIEIAEKFGLEMKYKPLETDDKQCEIAQASRRNEG